MGERATQERHAAHEFNAAEIGAIAHLCRGEVYRSTIWRARLDNTTVIAGASPLTPSAPSCIAAATTAFVEIRP